MRLFVALVAPADVLTHLRAAIGAVRREPVARDLADALRWTRTDQWHVTLAFLGEVGESAMPDLTARLGRAAHRHGPLGLAFTGCGRFGGRVLWAGVAGDRDPLGRLASSVGAAARRAGIEVDDRRYRPHVTLARARAPVDLRPLAAALSSYAGPTWTAVDVHLVRSRLGPHPSYDDVAVWPLGGPVGGPASTGSRRRRRAGAD